MSVRRVDRGELKKPVRAANGWLKVDAFITRTGVFNYVNPDGTIRREARKPEHVFDAESLASFSMVPVTDEHPPTFLDSENTWGYQRGHLGEAVVQAEDKVSAPLMITDSNLARKVERGDARELSCGYTCDLVEEKGKLDGEEYDFVQTNIRGNHVAVVPQGRAGSTVRIHMDAADAVMLAPGSAGDPIPPPNSEERPMANVKFRHDSIEYEAPEQVAQVVAKLDEKVQKSDAEAKRVAAEAKAKMDAQQAKIDALEADLAKEKKARADAEDPARMDALVKARAELMGIAQAALGKDFKLDGLSEKEIKLAVLEKERPDFKFDEKSDDYVQAAFDMAAVKLSKKKADSNENVRKTVNEDDLDDSADRLDAAAARKRMVEGNRNAWKREATKQ